MGAQIGSGRLSPLTPSFLTTVANNTKYTAHEILAYHTCYDYQQKKKNTIIYILVSAFRLTSAYHTGDGSDRAANSKIAQTRNVQRRELIGSGILNVTSPAHTATSFDIQLLTTSICLRQRKGAYTSCLTKKTVARLNLSIT